MSALTTHILDTSIGAPATGVKIRVLFAETSESEFQTVIGDAITNMDGRTDQPLIEGSDFKPGYFRIIFEVGNYFARIGVAKRTPAFLNEVPVDFGVFDPTSNHHVPLLVSPYGYSAYRGS